MRLRIRSISSSEATQRAPDQLVGGDIDVFLLIAVRVDAAIPSGDARERPICDQRSHFDCCGGNSLDHFTHRNAVRRLRRTAIKM
jgi:hypothetical protein